MISRSRYKRGQGWAPSTARKFLWTHWVRLPIATMIKRIVEISNPARLYLKHSQMVVERNGQEPASVPVEDLGILILDHPAITHTQPLLTGCLGKQRIVFLCDLSICPTGILIPLEGHSLQGKTFISQTQLSEPTRKRLWQTIIQSKIRAQAQTLIRAVGDNGSLSPLGAKVRSGDPDN